MDIYMIWAQDPEGNYYWLVNAWDDDSVAENFSGYQEAVAQARKEHGEDKIRVVKALIDFDKVVEAFEPTDVGVLDNPVVVEVTR